MCVFILSTICTCIAQEIMCMNKQIYILYNIKLFSIMSL